MAERDTIRWTDTDVELVVLLAFAIGLVVGGGVGLLAAAVDPSWAWLPAGVMLGGLMILVRSVRWLRRMPWWNSGSAVAERIRKEGSDDEQGHREAPH